ncbi:MAG: glycosyltransferase [Phenylobacterium sp.]|jgi:hypothetical protein|nr:glycosyltransferase [Phenylobacterium sp.]
MRILFIGVEGYENIVPGLRRLGHEVQSVDPFDALPALPGQLSSRWVWKTGALGVERLVERYVLACVGSKHFDVAFILRGELLSSRLIQKLPVARRINFNNDHPFGSRDGNRWRLFRQALPSYDLFVAPRDVTINAAKANGARKTVKVFLWADEVQHQPIDRLSIPTHLRSEVAFVGTWMPERGPFMLELLKRGVPLKIFGNHWNKASEYNSIKASLYSGFLSPSDYVKAVSGSRIAVAMLSKGNEDEHTRRSNEIPALGRLLCAELTNEHLSMYQQNEEAVFWSSAEECAGQCLDLLSNPSKIEEIALRGQERCRRNGYFTEPTLERILHELEQV